MKAITGVLFIALLATLALFSTAAYAEDPAKTTDKPKTTDTAKPEKLNAKELQVLAHYHELNVLEINLGKLAMKQSSSPAVKAYAEMLVKDHSDNDKKLKELAKQTKQTIPVEKPATDAAKQEQAEMKKQIAALKKLKGADFDRDYLRMMVDGHDKELATIQTRMDEVQNPAMLDMLSAKKPVLQKHADQARELQKTGAQASAGHGHP